MAIKMKDFLNFAGTNIEDSLCVTSDSPGLMDSESFTKLEGIEEGANKYVHPSSHSADMITTNVSRRFVSDTQITAWNSKASTTPATTSSNGLMSAADKTKLDGITEGANKYTHPTYTSCTAGLYKITVDETGHVSGATAVTKSDITGLGVTDTNTTYDLSASASSSNGNVKLNLIAGGSGSGTDSVYIKGSGATTVTTDSSGNVIVSSTDNNTTYSVVTTSSNGLMSSGDKTKLDGIATGATKVVVDSALSTTSTNAIQNKAVAVELNTKPGKIVKTVTDSGTNIGEVFNKYSGNTATGNYSHAEGVDSTASSDFSHAEGYGTIASGDSSHAEGQETVSQGFTSHAEGLQTKAEGSNAHAEGNNTTASGEEAHAEGYETQAIGDDSHAEGFQAIASGNISHAECMSKATGDYSHAEGNISEAIGEGSHAENDSTAGGDYSHAEGSGTTKGYYSHAEGEGTVASSRAQHAQGKFNIEDTNNIYAFIIGNGSSTTARSNAFTVDWNGVVDVEDLKSSKNGITGLSNFLLKKDYEDYRDTVIIPTFQNIDNAIKPVSVTLTRNSSNVPSSSTYTCIYVPTLNMCFFRGYLAERSSKTFAANTAYDLWTIPSKYAPGYRHALAITNANANRVDAYVTSTNGTISITPRGGTISTSNLLYITGWWLC